MPLVNRDNWTLDEKTGFLAPVVREVNGNSLMTIDQKVQFMELFSDTYNMSASAKAVGVAIRTIYDHLGFDAGFKRAYDEALLALRDESQSALVKQMRKGNIAAAFGILKRYDPKWRDKQQPEDEGKNKDKLKKLLDDMQTSGDLINL